MVRITVLVLGCERRPPKHLSHSESVSGETEPSKPSRAGNIPSLVPRPPETSLVKLVGKVYSLKCRWVQTTTQFVFNEPGGVAVWRLCAHRETAWIVSVSSSPSTLLSTPQMVLGQGSAEVLASSILVCIQCPCRISSALYTLNFGRVLVRGG